MVLEVRSDAGKVKEHGNASSTESRCRANAAPLQNRGSVESAGRNDHLGLCRHVKHMVLVG